MFWGRQACDDDEVQRKLWFCIWISSDFLVFVCVADVCRDGFGTSKSAGRRAKERRKAKLKNVYPNNCIRFELNCVIVHCVHITQLDTKGMEKEKMELYPFFTVLSLSLCLGWRRWYFSTWQLQCQNVTEIVSDLFLCVSCSGSKKAKLIEPQDDDGVCVCVLLDRDKKRHICSEAQRNVAFIKYEPTRLFLLTPTKASLPRYTHWSSPKRKKKVDAIRLLINFHSFALIRSHSFIQSLVLFVGFVQCFSIYSTVRIHYIISLSFRTHALARSTHSLCVRLVSVIFFNVCLLTCALILPHLFSLFSLLSFFVMEPMRPESVRSIFMANIHSPRNGLCRYFG